MLKKAINVKCYKNRKRNKNQKKDIKVTCKIIAKTFAVFA